MSPSYEEHLEAEKTKTIYMVMEINDFFQTKCSSILVKLNFFSFTVTFCFGERIRFIIK